MTGSPKRVLISRRREVFSYSDLWFASQMMHEEASAEERGATWRDLSCLVLTAFAVEAYLNHVGERHLTAWQWTAFERLGPRDKLKYVHSEWGAPIPKRSGEWQVILDLLKFRDVVAHGKSTVLEEQETVTLNDDVDRLLSKHPLTEWEKKVANGLFAGRAQKAAEFVLRKIDEVRPYKPGQRKEALFYSGFHESSGSVIDD